MSFKKSELKLALARALKCDLEDDLAAAERDSLRSAGRVQAAVALEQEISKIIRKLDADMASDTPPFKDPESHKQSQLYLTHALAACMTVSKRSDSLHQQMEGKVAAFKHTMARIQRICEAEAGKMAAFAREPAKEPPKERETPERHPHPRPIGKHPGPSLAARRKAEAKEAEE